MTGTISWAELLAEAQQRLESAGLDGTQAQREARWIVEEASGFEGSEFLGGLRTLATVKGVGTHIKNACPAFVVRPGASLQEDRRWTWASSLQEPSFGRGRCLPTPPQSR